MIEKSKTTKAGLIMQKLSKLQFINAFELKLIAMALMLCDHLWATVIPGNQWMTNIGRLAFPIFAFQIAEGYTRTHDFKKYLRRLFIFALISEIPFNLIMGGQIFNPFHQNVLFTFCIALVFIRIMDRSKEKGTVVFLLTSACCCLLGFIVGSLTMCDYSGAGVLTVFLFYFFHKLPYGWIGELIGMILLHAVLWQGMTYNFELFGHLFEIPQQAFAVLALIPIWLYNEKQGPHNKALQYAFYAFYPAHLLILHLIRIIFA